VWGTAVVGGSDSYCYVSQAGFWLDGSLLAPQPAGFTAPWPHAALSLVPTGYVPSPSIPGAIAPICSSGLALTMATAWALAGPSAVFVVVPLLGALAVWLTYGLGRELDRPATGLAAAVLFAASPILLYQIVQPMSDVPVTAWWLAALVLASRPGRLRSVGAGLTASAAILTRPNLAPLVAIITAFLFFRPVVRPRAPGTRWPGAADAAAFVVGIVPGAVALAWIQHALYGSPIGSGYGPVDQLFAWSRVVPNLQRYPRWLVDTHTPLVLIGLAAPFMLARRMKRAHADPATGGTGADLATGADGSRHAVWLAWLCLAVACAIVAGYLVYGVFEDWWYLRFLLPAIPLLIALSAVVLVAVVSRLPPLAAAPAGVVCVAALAVFCLHTAEARGAFTLRTFESRFRDAGLFVGDRLPDRAVVLTIWESGSVRYYGKRFSILWDAIDPAWLDRALAVLEAQGRPPYLLFETSEEAAFRERFQSVSRFGGLDWPPMAQIGSAVRIYNPADRARYYAGEQIATERVWPDRVRRRR
jgi:hypothetical protein